jgi:Protein of unknown function (DUF1254)
MTLKLQILTLAATLALTRTISTQAQTAPATASDVVPVTVENFIRAESDLYFGGVVKQVGIGKLAHIREPMPVDHQTVVRSNRDTLYSSGIFDLAAGPVTITMPDAGERFMIVIDEDHYVPVVLYAAGSHTLTREQIGTRYVMLGIRTLVETGSTSCRMRSRSSSQAPANSRCRIGTRSAKRKCGMRCSY